MRMARIQIYTVVKLGENRERRKKESYFCVKM